jgi:hypothetical protein
VCLVWRGNHAEINIVLGLSVWVNCCLISVVKIDPLEGPPQGLRSYRVNCRLISEAKIAPPPSRQRRGPRAGWRTRQRRPEIQLL